MDRKPRLLIQGSSWTVGAYVPSQTPNSDDLVPGGLADLLSQHYDVTNISVRDDFNLGCVHRLREHLSAGHYYDQLLICQNDPLRDLVVLRSTDTEWTKFFNFSTSDIFLSQSNSISKLLELLLTKFYEQVAALGIPTVVFAGPSQVNCDLARHHGLTPVPDSWTQRLVPGFAGSSVETSAELDYAAQMLQRMFPENSLEIKQQLCDYSDQISELLNTWRRHTDLFAIHHPTPLGNRTFYEYLRGFL